MFNKYDPRLQIAGKVLKSKKSGIHFIDDTRIFMFVVVVWLYSGTLNQSVIFLYFSLHVALYESCECHGMSIKEKQRQSMQIARTTSATLEPWRSLCH